MIVGVPTEIKPDERRVALTPAGAAAFRHHDHTVLVQRGAGLGSGFADNEYRAAGARVTDSAAAVWRRAALILKVKEPQPSEFRYLRPGLILFTYLHLAAERGLTRELLKRRVDALGYDTVQLEDGSLPLLAPMSGVACRRGRRRRSDDPRRKPCSIALPERTSQRPGGHPDVESCDARRRASRGRPRGWNRARAGRAHAAADHRAAGRDDEARGRAGRSIDRSGRHFRNVAADHPRPSHLHPRGCRSLLRDQYAGCGAAYVNLRADQRRCRTRSISPTTVCSKPASATAHTATDSTPGTARSATPPSPNPSS